MKGPIRVVAIDEQDEVAQADQHIDDSIQRLPDQHILDAGVEMFKVWANLHWPTKPGADEKFKMESFNYKNDYHLRITLGMVFLAMQEAEREGQ